MVLLAITAGGLVLSLAIVEQSKLMEKALIQENKLVANVISQSIETGYIKKQWPFSTIKQVSESENILFLWVVKPDGEIILADDAEMWGKKIDDSHLGVKEQVVTDSTFDGKRIKLIIHPLNIEEAGQKWELYIGVSLESIAAARNKMIISSLGFFILIIVFATMLSFYLAKSVTEPIRRLTDAANKISMGDFKVKIKIKSKDEIGELAKSFKRMVNSLKILMKQARL